ncbi:MAG: substrate-binding domain-containing protein, partial [Kiritimatiellaeota bacterium]|nr:substrate-binding domain-containing protein [Kiritimatiellota bacterium]
GEQKLAKQLGVSLMLVRRTLSELEEEGVLYRQRRSGTFVRKNMLTQKNIAVLLFDIVEMSNPFCKEMFRGINKALDSKNYSIHIHPIRSRRISGEGLTYIEKQLNSGEIDAVLLLSSLEVKELKMLESRSIPYVLAGFEYKNHEAPCVLPDTSYAFEKMIKYLVENGHPNIAIIAGYLDAVGRDEILTAEEKLERLHLEIQNLPGLESYELKRSFYSREDGERLMIELLDSGNPPSAVLAHGNYLTEGALQAIEKKGLKTGRGIVLVGYLEDISGFPKPLIRNPVFEIGKRSAEKLLNLINGEKNEKKRDVVESEFVFI